MNKPKYVYKIVTRNTFNIDDKEKTVYYSCASHLPYSIEYKLAEWIKPKLQNSKLFVYILLDDVKKYLTRLQDINPIRFDYYSVLICKQRGFCEYPKVARREITFEVSFDVWKGERKYRMSKEIKKTFYNASFCNAVYPIKAFNAKDVVEKGILDNIQDYSIY